MTEQHIRKESPLSEITTKVIGAAKMVHAGLGPGFEEEMAMSDATIILNILEKDFNAVRSHLGPRWTEFSQRAGDMADRFQTLTNMSDLEAAVDGLLAVCRDYPYLARLLKRAEGEQSALPGAQELDPEKVANRYYFLLVQLKTTGILDTLEASSQAIETHLGPQWAKFSHKMGNMAERFGTIASEGDPAAAADSLAAAVDALLSVCREYPGLLELLDHAGERSKRPPSPTKALQFNPKEIANRYYSLLTSLKVAGQAKEKSHVTRTHA